MLPVTPTRDWNIIPNRRSVISPDESDQGNNNNHNNNNNPFVLLEDSDSDDDESTSSFPSDLTLIRAETSTPAFEIDIGATDHIVRPTKRFAVDIRLVPAHCDFLRTRGSHFCFAAEVRS
jgi:hypothetical protein